MPRISADSSQADECANFPSKPNEYGERTRPVVGAFGLGRIASARGIMGLSPVHPSGAIVPSSATPDRSAKARRAAGGAIIGI
jgi:hypothetical protein